MVNAVQNIWRHADAMHDHIALRDERRSWSYGELRAHARSAAEELSRRGVTRGDRVLIVLRRARSSSSCTTACWRLALLR